jgi:hypothetical protein
MKKKKKKGLVLISSAVGWVYSRISTFAGAQEKVFLVLGG